MSDLTEKDERRVNEWLDNTACDNEVIRALSRLIASTPGVEAWAVMLAVLQVWDGLDAGSKLEAIGLVAAPPGGLKDGWLTDVCPDDEPGANGFPTGKEARNG